MYRNILDPVVFDNEHDQQNASRLAHRLASPDAKVTVLHVVEQLPGHVTSYIPESMSKQLRVKLRDDMESLLRGTPAAEGKIIEGHPGRSTDEYADKKSVNLIIVDSHRPSLGNYVMGSTASHIVRHAKWAVHVMR